MIKGLSLCIITRDEEKNIADCLESARGIVDEIVLVDTVSEELNRVKEWIPLLERCGFVGVRGPISRWILEQHGFHDATVVGDLALLWAQPEARPKRMGKKLGINIGISPEETWGHPQNILAVMVNFARMMIDRGWDITFVPMFTDDIPYIQEAMRQIGQPTRSFGNYESLRDVMAWLQSCDVFIGEKLHSVVLACCAYTPSIMLEYRPKCRDFMASLDLEDYNLRTDSLDLERMVTLCDYLYEHSGEMQRVLYERVNGYKKIIVDSIARISA